MFCSNCGKGIEQGTACVYCGYDPSIDDADVKTGVKHTPTSSPELIITVHKSANKAAIVGLIFSILSVYPLFMILGFIFDMIGLSKIKYCHRGVVLVVLGLIFLVFWILFWTFGIKALMQNMY